MKTQLVYKVVRFAKSNYYISARVPVDYALKYKLFITTTAVQGYICTFDTLEHAKEFKYNETILCGIGYNPVKLKYLADYNSCIPIFWNRYFAKKSTKEYRFNAPKGTIGVTAFKPLEIVK